MHGRAEGFALLLIQFFFFNSSELFLLFLQAFLTWAEQSSDMQQHMWAGGRLGLGQTNAGPRSLYDTAAIWSRHTFPSTPPV